MRFAEKIHQAIRKLDLNLDGLHILTEAATGNYVVTPVIAAIAGANVIAFTRDSAYGSVQDVIQQTMVLSEEMNVSHKIDIVDNLSGLNLSSFDIVTNCGFLRPLDRAFISRLSSNCVIPLMYEPWEFREAEIDLDACREKGIKVYGTNESDSRLRTMEYIGYTALYFLLEGKLSPFSAKVLILGCEQFVCPVSEVLGRNGYKYLAVTSYEERVDPREFNAIIVAEFADNRLLVGPIKRAYVRLQDISPDAFLIHIAGNVDLVDAKFAYTPAHPRRFRFMSYTTDFIDPQAVVDLHAAGLKVGEGMLKANRKGLCGFAGKCFMEQNYPALAFEEERLW